MKHNISDEYINTGNYIIKVKDIVFAGLCHVKKRFKKEHWMIVLYVNNIISNVPHDFRMGYSTEKRAEVVLEQIRQMMNYQAKRKGK